MTIKLAIKFAVFCRALTLVAKYAFLQAPSHLEIWLVGSRGDCRSRLPTTVNVFLSIQRPPSAAYGAPVDVARFLPPRLVIVH